MTEKKMMFKNGLALFVLFTLLSVSTVFAKIEDVSKKEFKVKAGGTLTMDVDKASIEILADRGKGVSVELIKKAKTEDNSMAKELFGKYKVDYSSSGNDVKIETTIPDKRKFWKKNNKLQVKFIIRVPKKYNLALMTSGGSIVVSNIEGEVKTRTSGGSLKFNSVKGNLIGKTSGGSIKLKDCSGDVSVGTSGGSINIGTVSGTVKAHTSGGSIRVTEVMGKIDASTSGGSVKAYISKQPKADCYLKTSGGSINVKLDAKLRFNLDARTSGGTVSTDFPVKVSGKLRRNKLQSAINGGGPELVLKSSGGSIRISKID